MKPIINATSGSSNLSVMHTLGMSSEYLWELDQVMLRLATAATAANSFTITKRSKRSSAYDCVILTQAMVGVQDVLWQPDRPIKFNGKDRLEFSWTNDAASFKTWGLEYVYRA
jgi:hypothetical protein